MQTLKLDSLRLLEVPTALTSIQCVICHEIPLNPKECGVCQNLFCEECVGAWLAIKPVCPCFCSEEQFRPRQAHKFIRDLIGNLKMRCVNAPLGCQTILRFENAANHEKNHCQFRRVPCPKGFCKEQLLLRDVEAHSEKCVVERRWCPQCKAGFTAAEFDKHQCVVALFEQARVLADRCAENESKVRSLEEEISVLSKDNKKKADINSILEKLVKDRVKDLKLYMLSEVETVFQDIIKNHQREDQKLKQARSEMVFHSDSKGPGFTSKFFSSLNEQNPKDSESSVEENQKQEDPEGKGEEADAESSEEEETKGVKGQPKRCHQNYRNLTWMIIPEKLKCGNCSQVNWIRYRCQECRKNLCVACKKPRFKGDRCPAAHKLIKGKIKEDAVCDICSGNIKAGELSFSDAICEADVCLFCHQ